MNRTVPVLFLLILIVVEPLHAQGIKTGAWLPFSYNPGRHARASNGAVTVLVDRQSGRFAVQRNDGTSLLFLRNDGMTSFTNIRLAGRVFTNNSLNGPQTPDRTTMMPEADIDELPGQVVARRIITFLGKSVEVRQSFVPMLDQDYAFVRVTTSITNLSQGRVSCGSLLMMDLMIGFEDYVRVEIDSVMVSRETGYRRPDIPAEWFGTASLSPVRVRARLAGGGTTPPDLFVVGRWQYNGYLGAASWDYTASGLRFGDNAVLMQWDELDLDPQQTRSVVTDYGYIATLSSRLSCSVESMRFDPDLNDYTPNPFRLTGTVTNTGDVDLANVALTIDALPPKITFAPGETAAKTFPQPIPAGQSASLEWRLRAAPFAAPANLPFVVRQTAPPMLPDTCRTSTVIPLTPAYTAVLVCDSGVTVRLDAAQTGYANSPFTLAATVTNTGNVPLDSLYATIAVPPRLQLVGMPATIPVVPATLQPNQSAILPWTVAALSDTATELLNCTISLAARHGVRLSCSQQVFVPGIIDRFPCVENGIGTKGTDFWFATPPNPQGNSAESLIVYIAGPKKAHVTIARPGLGLQSAFDVLPGTIGSFNLEYFHNEAAEEVVEMRGVHVTSDEPVAVYFANLRLRHSDATMILPTHALGTSYLTVGYNWNDPMDHFIVCGTEDNTMVTIIPSGATSLGRAPGVPFNVTLNAGETYYVYSDWGGKAGGLTGSLITADKPVAVLGGDVSGHIPFPDPYDYGYLNPTLDQFLPLHLLGTEYVIVPFRSRLRGDHCKIVATENQTTVSIDGSVAAVLSMRGDAFETPVTRPSIIQSDKPVLVAHFASSAQWDSLFNEYGDGSMVILSPTNRFPACHAFPTGLMHRFDSSFVNVVVPEGVQGAVSLDGTLLPDTAFHRVAGSPFLAGQFLLSPGLHAVETPDPRGIGAVVYGFEYHDAFTFNSGFLLTRKVRGDRDDTAPRLPIGNYPNPFNPATTIAFRVPTVSGGRGTHVLLTVHDLAGREVARLVDRELPPGAHTANWDAGGFPSGLYTCRLSAAGAAAERTMMLVK